MSEITVRLPTGTITYQESPQATARDPMPDHGYVEMRVELSPEDAAKIQSERATLSAGYTTAESAPSSATAPRRRLNPGLLGALAMMTLGMDLTPVSEPEEREPDEDDPPEAPHYAFRQQSVQANYTALMPDGSLQMVYSTPLEAAVVKHWDPFAHHVYRRDQRENRKRRAARKRKRGWA